MTYYEQLKSPEWAAKRQEIIDIANGLCEICENENLKPNEKLQVHHGVYIKDKMAWDYPNDVLYCLCPICHWNIQGDMDELYLEIGRRGLQLDRIRVTVKRGFKTREEREIWQSDL